MPSADIVDDQAMEKNVKTIKHTLEKRMLPVDVLMLLWFVKLAYFSRPFWCIAKIDRMTVA